MNDLAFDSVCEYIDSINDIELLDEILKKNREITLGNIFWKYWAIYFESKDLLERKRAHVKCRYIERKMCASVPISSNIHRFVTPHGLTGIHISLYAKIGTGCTIMHNVTIGSNTFLDSKKGGFPVVGNNVFIGAGAKIIGGITVGDNVRIGANCVVVEDVPSNSVVVMAKPRIISRTEVMDNKFLDADDYIKLIRDVHGGEEMGTTNNIILSQSNDDTSCETTDFRYKLTKKLICSILGLPEPEHDEEYTSVRFARDSKKDCIAVVINTGADPNTEATSPQQRIELAKEAIEKGAKLLIVKTEIEGYPCLVVDSVFDAYCRIVRSLRSFYSPKTIGITGSIGKTTTTQMVYNVLKTKFNTHRNTSSANNYRLAGYFVQAIAPKHEAYVQEIMEGPPYGAAEVISKMVQPDAAIVTVVGSSHMQAFGSKERILESCLGIQEGMPENGLLILNGDDPYQKNAVVKKKVVYYGIDDENAEYRAINLKTNDTNIEFDIIHESEKTHIVLYCFGRHNVLDALAAFAAGKWAGMTNEEISAALSKHRSSGIRQNLVKFGGYRIFLDCYNAAVESMKTALEQLGEIPVAAGGKRIAVLADIKESGDMTVDYHKQTGVIAAASCADIVICYGDNARYIAEEAQKSKKTHYTASANELMKIIKENVTENDIIMFKGSHGMKLEQIVDNIWGTWFHEEYEVYEYRTKNTSDNDMSYRIYTDHVSVTNKISTKSDIVIPDVVDNLPVRSISPSAFSGSQSIRHIIFPKNLVNIRYCAFYNSMLEGEIVIPSSVRIIHESAFSTCKNLTIAVINNGCTHLGYRAFGNCTSLESIVIPETVRQIGNEAFINCKKLTILGKEGSYAEEYAKNNSIPFSKII